MGQIDTRGPATFYLQGFQQGASIAQQRENRKLEQEAMEYHRQQQAQQRDRLLASEAARQRVLQAIMTGLSPTAAGVNGASADMNAGVGAAGIPGVGGAAALALPAGGMGAVPGIPTAAEAGRTGGVGRLMDKVDAAGAAPAWTPPPDPFAGISPDDLAMVDSGLQNTVVRGKMDRESLIREREDERRMFEIARREGYTNVIAPQRVQRWLEYGFPISREDMPKIMRNVQDERSRAVQQAQLSAMVDGGVPGAAQWANESPEMTAIRYGDWKQKNEAQAARVEWDRRFAMQQLDDQHRATLASATAAFNGADVDFKAATKAEAEAEKTYLLASGGIKKDSNGNQTPIASVMIQPPTAEERKRLETPADTDFGDGVSDMDEDEYGRLKTKVAAWDALVKARAAAAEAKKRADNASGLIIKANQTREKALGQLIQGLQNPGQQPTAQPAGPVGMTPAGASWEDAGQGSGGANGQQPERLSVSGSPAPEISDDHLMQAINELGPDASDAAIAARAAQIAGGSR